jgi:hypothetical protein
VNTYVLWFQALHNLQEVKLCDLRSSCCTSAEDIAQHLAEASRPAAAAPTARGRGGSHSSSAAGRYADRAAGQRLEYGLELLGLAVGRGHTATLMKKGPAAGKSRLE